MITSPEHFAGVALLRIGRAKTAKELRTLYGDCQEAEMHGDIQPAEYDALISAIEQREPVALLLDAIRDAKDGAELNAAGKWAHTQRAAEQLTLAQFEEVVRAGKARHAELKGQDQ